jgi:hypothetical protein
MQKKYNTIKSFFYKQKITLCISILLLSLTNLSCQKDIKLDFGNGTIKQVIIANFYPNSILRVSISKSKNPDDYNPVEFLNNNKVELYENGSLIEIMPFILKDTLSGLGFYTSTYKLKQNKTYKVISYNEQLGTAYTEEFLPTYPTNVSVELIQHADTIHPNVRGKYSLTFQDSANAKNYYFVVAYYKARRMIVDSLGDTTYKWEYLYTVPSFTPEIPNPTSYYKSFFKDDNFDGQLKTFVFDISSQYDNTFESLFDYYIEFYFELEFASVGPGYYEWYLQQMPKNDDVFNNGQNERINFTSNIVNGFGYFAGRSSLYYTIRIK